MTDNKKTKRILCSTGAIIGRANNRDFRLIKTYGEKLNCDGFELMIYKSWYDQIDELIENLKCSSCSFPVLHADKMIGEMISRNQPIEDAEAVADFKKNVRIAEAVGAKKIVLHLWGGEPSDKQFEHNMKMLPVLYNEAMSRNIELTVENVVCNTKTPMERMCELVDQYSAITFTYDTKMAHFHREENKLYLPEYKKVADRIVHYHVNDHRGEKGDFSSLRVLHPGKGDVDFGSFFKYVNSTKYSGDFTVEATSIDENGRVDINSLNRTFELIKNNIQF